MTNINKYINKNERKQNEKLYDKNNHTKMNKRKNYFNRIKENFADGKNSNKKKIKKCFFSK